MSDADIRATTKWLLVVVIKECRVPSSPSTNRMHATSVDTLTILTYTDHITQKK